MAHLIGAAALRSGILAPPHGACRSGMEHLQGAAMRCGPADASAYLYPQAQDDALIAGQPEFSAVLPAVNFGYSTVRSGWDPWPWSSQSSRFVVALSGFIRFPWTGTYSMYLSSSDAAELVLQFLNGSAVPLDSAAVWDRDALNGNGSVAVLEYTQPRGLYQLNVTFHKTSDLAPYLHLEWAWRGAASGAPTEEAPHLARQTVWPQEYFTSAAYRPCQRQTSTFAGVDAPTATGRPVWKRSPF
ncbi:hypothetical protein WJX81_002730 [Elliptochloris bilobata]|uniref:PA14 domain-containing protein n=1 Tax=Elliptochloris bilobata TaxID=381761 RepID=A0AAW1QMZ8_9CHLO